MYRISARPARFALEPYSFDDHPAFGRFHLAEPRFVHADRVETFDVAALAQPSPVRMTEARLTDALAVGGVSAATSDPGQTAGIVLIGDDIPGDTSTTATIGVGESAVSTLETIGDQDFFKVELQAGQTYEITMVAKYGGPNGVPLADAYFEVYDAAGHKLADADGGADTTHNSTNSGFDAALTFTATTSGTYYINARAYDDGVTGDGTGNYVGDYELAVHKATAATYHPYYDADSPLYSIDWGTQVVHTSRNPDGEEGPRATGNPYTGTGWNAEGIEGKNVIYYYFAKSGEVFIDENPATVGTTDTMIAKGFDQWEKDAYLVAIGEYEKVADVVYVEVQNKTDADFIFITYLGTPGPGVSLLGRMSPPGEENAGRSEFNAADERWTPEGLAPGGFSFTTLIHEMGHGHGLAHPHDNGGHSGVMNGVEDDGPAFSYTNGDYDLNQAVYTMMSYEDGWEKSPLRTGRQPGSLWLARQPDGVRHRRDPGQIRCQRRYRDAATTFTSSRTSTRPAPIIPASGTPAATTAIVYNGAEDANIDLRPARSNMNMAAAAGYPTPGAFTAAIPSPTASPSRTRRAAPATTR